MEKVYQMIKMKDVAGAQELLDEHIQGAKELMLSTLLQREQNNFIWLKSGGLKPKPRKL